jgi:hypothetical protein
MLEPITGKIEVPTGNPTVKECLDLLQAKRAEEKAAAARVQRRP